MNRYMYHIIYILSLLYLLVTFPKTAPDMRTATVSKLQIEFDLFALPLPAISPVIPQPVYEQTLGNIRFVFQSAIDRGNILRAANISNSQYTYYSGQKDLFATTEFLR